MKNKLSFRSLIENPEFRSWVLKGTTEFAEKWQTIYDNTPEARPAIEAAREYLEVLGQRPKSLSESRKRQIWDNIRSETGIEPTRKVLPLNEHFRSKKLARQKWSILAAACVTILVISFFLLERPILFMEEEPLVETIVKATAAGQKSKIHLPDGSIVYLNAESEITYDKHFSKEHRFVTLKGEGFFDVAKNEQLPFTVKSHNILTTALGTIFNINAQNEENISIHLVEGKIKVGEDGVGQTEILKGGQKIDYRKGDGFSKARKVESLNDILWKDGILVFDNTPLSEITELLERWYGVDVEIIGNPGSITFSGTYDDEYLSNVLKSMSFSMGFNYSIDGNNVKLKFK